MMPHNIAVCSEPPHAASRVAGTGGAATLLQVLILLAALVSTPPSASATALHDPFLERFRVGYYEDPQKVAMQDGWPADLFLPLEIDAAWRQAAEEFFAPESLARGDRQVTWRLLVPAIAGHTARERWYRLRRERVAALLGGGRPGPDILAAGQGNEFLAKESIAMAAFAAHDTGNWREARRLAALLLENRRRLKLSAEEILVWKLRLRWLAERCGETAVPAREAVWPELDDVGPYDARSGWALWRARRSHFGMPLIPPGAGTTDLARFLARLPEGWLSAADLAGGGFPKDAAAGLGAVALSRADLAQHFRAFPTPPADNGFQMNWLRGQRRLAGGKASRYEELARLPGLLPGPRLDIWRRASERRLLAGQWTEGLAALEAALQQIADSPPRGPTRRLRQWTVQALVLARASGRDADARHIFDLADRYLVGPQKQAFTDEAAYWRTPRSGAAGRAIAGAAAPAGDRLAGARQRVRAGRVQPLATKVVDELAERNEQRQARLWRLWIEWGLGLVAQEATAVSQDSALDAYREGLRAAQAADSDAQAYAAICATLGRLLRWTDLTAPVLEWTLARDIHVLGGSDAQAPRSPLARLARRQDQAQLDQRLRLHALLGICLATADSHGQLIAATRLPRAGLSLDEKLLFLYPLPVSEPLLAALATARLEPATILAVARNESAFEPAARSRAGALGWMQIMPFHYPDRGIGRGAGHWSQAVNSAQLGAALLRENLRRYAGDAYRTAAAYNAGPTAVDRWQRQLGGVEDDDLFLAWIGYPETRGYVEKVLVDREIYAWILASQRGTAQTP